MKRRSIIVIALVFMFIFEACKTKVDVIENNTQPETTTTKELSLDITTTNKLLYFMIKDIVKDRHNVEYMFTDKDKLWNFDFTEDSISNISKKDIFFYFGSGLEPWAQAFVDSLRKDTVAPVNVSRGVKFIDFDREIKYKDAPLKTNPYFWLSIDDYKIAMLNIKNAIQDKDSKNRDFYEENFSKTIKEVEDYQRRLKEVTAKLKDVTFVTDGDKLDYFIRTYGFQNLKLYNYGLILTEEEQQKNKIVENEFINPNNIVFLYDTKEMLESNKDIVEKFKLKTCNIVVYSDDMDYKSILNNNLNSLERLASDLEL